MLIVSGEKREKVRQVEIRGGEVSAGCVRVIVPVKGPEVVVVAVAFVSAFAHISRAPCDP